MRKFYLGFYWFCSINHSLSVVQHHHYYKFFLIVSVFRHGKFLSSCSWLTFLFFFKTELMLNYYLTNSYQHQTFLSHDVKPKPPPPPYKMEDVEYQDIYLGNKTLVSKICYITFFIALLSFSLNAMVWAKNVYTI